MELQFHRTKNWNLDDVILVSSFIMEEELLLRWSVVAGGGAKGGVLVEINDGEGYGE
jgi:hypothetical protein